MRQATLNSYLLNRDYTSMLSTLEFTLGHIVFSTEATISVRVIDGSWRDEFHALFAASTTSIYHKKIVLLYSKDEKIVLTDDGNIKLSPSVASVEIEGKLKVSVRAWAASGGANNALQNELACTPNELAASPGDNNALEGELAASRGAINAVVGEVAASRVYKNVVEDELMAAGGDTIVVEDELAISHAHNNVVEDEFDFSSTDGLLFVQVLISVQS